MSAPLLRSRWRAYRDLLRTAQGCGYAVMGVDQWQRRPPRDEERCLVLRHDVDQQPASALRMAAIERDVGVQSTWYLRWRTAHPRVVADLRAEGAVGLHYETLSRAVLGGAAPGPALVERCRAALREEIAAFGERFGAIRSICPHGDTRAPGVRNHELLRGEDPAAFGVVFDGNEVMHRRPLGAWLTDRPGGATWKDDARPAELFARGVTPIFAVIHPNNWTARSGAAADRLLRVTLPDPTRPSRPLRSGSDEPPL
jgi:hypothetical protein